MTGFLVSSIAVFTSHAFAVEATLSGNAGILSEYIFRGVPQNDSSGNGGLDLEVGGFYLGTWIGDVGQGNEYDIYAGYIHEFLNGFYLGIGGTSYQYSDNFDSEYNEVNFYTGWSNDDFNFDIEYSTGEYNGDFIGDDGGVEGDEYDFLAITGGWKRVYVTYGMFGDDAEDSLGEYIEAGYGFEVAGFDVTAAIVHTDYDNDPLGLAPDGDDDETQPYVGIHRSFDIMKWGK